MSADNITIPRVAWESLIHKVDFLCNVIQPLAKGYKPKDYMTAAEVMEALGIKETRLKQLRASGSISYRKFGKTIEYLTKDINDYKNGHIVISKPTAA